MAEVKAIQYGHTNCYVIRGSRGNLLFDTDWAGTYGKFRRALKDADISGRTISYLLISHYHPDHMGIAQEIVSAGARLLVPDVQKAYLHASDAIFAKEKSTRFYPLRETDVLTVSREQSRNVLAAVGIEGEVLSTPGHSADSVSLVLDDGTAFVGDLCPLFTVLAYQNQTMEDSWSELLRHDLRRIFYGHFPPQQLSGVHSLRDIPTTYG